MAPECSQDSSTRVQLDFSLLMNLLKRHSGSSMYLATLKFTITPTSDHKGVTVICFYCIL